MPFLRTLLLSFSLFTGSAHAAMQNQYALVFFFKALARTAIRHHQKSRALANALSCQYTLFLLMVWALLALRFLSLSPLKLPTPFSLTLRKPSCPPSF